MSIDRSTIWPYENGEPGDVLLLALREPDRRRGGAGARRARRRPCAPLSRRAPAQRPPRARAVAAGRHDRARRRAATSARASPSRRSSAGGFARVEFDQTTAPPKDVQLVWLEAPSNPFLTMPDLEAAAAHPAPVVVDATASTPVHLRPLEHGADFVLHSATKYLAGHHDALLGAVVVQGRGDRDRAAHASAPSPASSPRPILPGSCCAA